jgi:hypothetical protein
MIQSLVCVPEPDIIPTSPVSIMFLDYDNVSVHSIAAGVETTSTGTTYLISESPSWQDTTEKLTVKL